MTAQLDSLIYAMMEYYKGDAKRIQHFLKVHQLARLIGHKEQLEEQTQLILETAALVHDIGIKPAEEKFGSCDGKLQEQEGPAPARAMLQCLEFDSAVIDRNAGHLLQQPLHVGIGGHLECIGIIAHRIALLGGAECLYLLHYGFDGDGRFPQRDLSQIFGRLRHPKLLFGLFISHESHGQGI